MPDVATEALQTSDMHLSSRSICMNTFLCRHNNWRVKTDGQTTVLNIAMLSRW